MMIELHPRVEQSGRFADGPVPIGREAIAWAARMLRRQGMPSNEVDAVLAVDDQQLVRRHMELHRERLEERLADQLRALAGLERLLIEAILARDEPGRGRTRGRVHETEGGRS
jgi:hypothetical protein